MKRLLQLAKWLALGLLALLATLLMPIGYVEVFCKGGDTAEPYQPMITEPARQRKEANSYLTYPEWHIVYAYEGLAEVLRDRDEHEFSYAKSVGGFWSSYCALNRVAAKHGGADWNTRQTAYVIGASFTFEMLMKALYEETIGRVTAALRGPLKTPQDEIARDMAQDYAAFLNQTPWYQYDFENAQKDLQNAPITNVVRGYERRLGLGGEWWAKAKYAGVIANAVEATGVAQLNIYSIVADISEDQLKSIKDVKLVAPSANGFLIETPRYARFTEILGEVFSQGGKVLEIAGNDDILVTAVGNNQTPLPTDAVILSDVARDGFADRRLLLSTKVNQLHVLFSAMKQGPLTLEHVYDY